MSNVLLVSFVLSVACVSTIMSVEHYTDLDFSTKIKTHPIALVDFYAPWCRYSQGLAPEFDAAAYILKDVLKLQDVTLVKVDCYEEHSGNTCSDNKVFGYPTLKVFKYGVLFKDYTYQRKTDAIVYFMLDIVNGLVV